MALKFTLFTQDPSRGPSPRPSIDPGPRINTATDWPFPFPAPGRPKPVRPDAVPPPTAHRWPYRPLDPDVVPNRGVPAPVPLAEFKRTVAAW
ncbi:MAG TPA: hypothetical protein VII47_12865, partial [Actinomycetota bacterium]